MRKFVKIGSLAPGYLRRQLQRSVVLRRSAAFQEPTLPNLRYRPHTLPTSPSIMSSTSSEYRAGLQDGVVQEPPSCGSTCRQASQDNALTLHEKDDDTIISGVSPTRRVRPRICLLYIDEGVRERFCSNAQVLLQTALQDPLVNSRNAQLARKALQYRKLMSWTEEIALHDPMFDASAFFGVKWQRNGTLLFSEVPHNV